MNRNTSCEKEKENLQKNYILLYVHTNVGLRVGKSCGAQEKKIIAESVGAKTRAIYFSMSCLTVGSSDGVSCK